MTDSGNIQQAVYDCFPSYPKPITLYSILDALPFAKKSIYRALKELKRKKMIENEPHTRRAVYRKRQRAQRPIDMRGQHGKSGRPRAGQ